MAIQDYDKIKSEMPDALRMKLDHIKRYLDEGRAAAFVGAGFSKNARMPEAAEMKDWNALGIDFYTRLYGDPGAKGLWFQNPINLATQVEASFGRHELDEMIQQSLPDDVIVHGKLHVDLLNLGWHDIFTTNYDTLLERACLDADHPYTVVYNRDTLLYSTSPRIVKLHGSFPNIRPYIITEEDFRTYPQIHPEFVNTVRQALIENLFCLIGFSGDDPNFKSWLGWLRDVMGKQLSPVYFITYDRNLHDSRRNLLAKQNIEVLNLHELPYVSNLQEAFEFFFRYLKSEHDTVWTGKLRQRYQKLETADQVRGLTKEMAEIRLRYPRWLVLPKRYYDDFQDVRSDMVFWSKASEIPGIDPEEWVRFLCELKWRLEVSFTPIGVEWFVSALEKLSVNQSEQSYQILDLKLALLKHYRIVGKETEYNNLSTELNGCLSILKTEQLRRFYYDRCLMASSKMDFRELRSLLTDWKVYETDFLGALWKSAMLIEANMRNEALNLLGSASTQLRRTILNSQQQSDYYKSCQVAIERSLALFKFERHGKKYPACDYVEEIKFFRDALKEEADKRETNTTRTHGFNIDDESTTWHLGPSGYVAGYLYPYRYYALCEQVGIPVGMVGMTLNTSNQTIFLSPYIHYNHYFPLGILARCCNSKLVLSVLDRKAMATFSRDLANECFDVFYSFANQLEKSGDALFHSRIVQSCIPVLVRLCSKVSDDRVKRLAMFLIMAHDYYDPFEKHNERQYLKTVYNSLRVDDMLEVLAQVYERQLTLKGDEVDELYVPMGWSDGVKFSDNAVRIVVNGLADGNAKIQEAAFLRAYQILRGKIDADEKDSLKKAVAQWRNATRDIRHVCFSYLDVPAEEGEKYNLKYFLQKYIDELLSVDVNDVRTSMVFDRLAELYHQLNYCNDLFETVDMTVVLEHFCKFVTNNVAVIQNADESFFGGFRNNMVDVVDGFTLLLNDVELSVLPEATIQRLTETAKTLGDMGYSHLEMLTRLERYNKALKEKELKLMIQDAITSTATLRQSIDVVKALSVLNERGRSFQTQVYQIISLCEYSKDSSVSNWLYALYNLVVKRAFKKTGIPRLHHLLDAKYVNNNYGSNDADYLNDVRHGISLLAGAMAREWGDSEPTNKWKELLGEENDEFNEVRCAFERGYLNKPI